MPGAAFGFPKESLTARLSFVDFDGEELLKLLKNKPDILVDNSFVVNNCPRIVEALNEIKRWLNSI